MTKELTKSEIGGLIFMAEDAMQQGNNLEGVIKEFADFYGVSQKYIRSILEERRNPNPKPKELT